MEASKLETVKDWWTHSVVQRRKVVVASITLAIAPTLERLDDSLLPAVSLVCN